MNKNNIKNLIIIILISLFACIPFLKSGTIEGNDTAYHLNRIICISEELKNGDLLALIHSRLLNNFGYGNGLFYPQLFLYIPAILIICGLEVIVSYKIFIVLITLCTSFIMYHTSKVIIKDNKKSLIITFLYVLSTYRLGDIYVRSALGEILCFVFVPLIVLGLYYIILDDYKKWWVICIGIWGIINSHVLTSLIIVFFIFVFILFNLKQLLREKIRIKYLFQAGLFSILISINFICNMYEQIRSNLFLFEIYDNSKFLYDGASSIQDLLKNHLSTVGPEFSIDMLLLLLTGYYILIKKRKSETTSSIFLNKCFYIGVFFLIISTKMIPWNRLAFLSIIQFPFRFSIIFTTMFSFVAGDTFVDMFKSKEVFNLATFLLILYVGNQIANINININGSSYDAMINNYPVGLNEYMPANSNTYVAFVCDFKDVPIIKKNEFLEIIDCRNKNNEKVNIEDIKKYEYEKKGSQISFEYDKNEIIDIHIPLTYYKGYQAFIVDKEGNRTKLKLEKEELNGNIRIISDKPLQGKIVIKYEPTIVYQISYFFNICSIALLIYIILKQKGIIQMYLKH